MSRKLLVKIIRAAFKIIAPPPMPNVDDYYYRTFRILTFNRKERILGKTTPFNSYSLCSIYLTVKSIEVIIQTLPNKSAGV